jgi:D-3-phosphoglycerate dehydrogenase
MKIIVTESQEYSHKAIEIYQSLGTVKLLEKLTLDNLNEITDADVLVVRLGIGLTAKILKQAPNLKHIITPTTGLNHIDLAYTQKNNITIHSLKGETAFLNQIPSTAEHTWALILATQRKLIPAVNHTSNMLWNRDLFKGYNLRGKKLGIIGLGRVGKQVAKFANCFDMEVIFYDPLINEFPIFTIQKDNCKAVFTEADIITIHIPLSIENENFIGKEFISLMKPNAIIVNTSRGEVWDEESIANALINKKISAVATDVLVDEFNMESIKKNKLIHLQQNGYPVIITPHIAGATYDSMQETELFIANKFKKN